MSPHANYVVQKIVEVMTPAKASFVIEELLGSAVQTSQHRYGCRVICRLLEHFPHEQTDEIINEVLLEVSALNRHSYGNYVVRHILEHGTDAQKDAVVNALLVDPLGFACHRTGSSVVEQALLHASPGGKEALGWALLACGEAAARLACSRYGSYVARALLARPGAEAGEAHSLFVRLSSRLRESKYGKRVLSEMSAAA